MGNLINLVGKKFGRWQVVSKEKSKKYPNGAMETRWGCVCECGNTGVVSGKSLREGSSKSCGCWNSDVVKERTRLPEGQSALNITYNSYRDQAAKRGYSFNLSKEFFRNKTQENCFYCGSPPSNVMKRGWGDSGYFTYNGLDRVDNTQGYTEENVVPCCTVCNTAKRSLTYEDFICWVKNIYNNLSRIGEI